MGKRKGANSGGAAQLSRKDVKPKKVEVESDAESDASENFMQFNKSKKDDSDEEQDREVFNLAIDDEDDEVILLLIICDQLQQCENDFK